MANKRVFYGIYEGGFAENGSSAYIPVSGMQSVGVTTRFNLENVFQIGQSELYASIENIPDVEITAEKVFDGHAMLYHLATPKAVSATLIGRSNERCMFSLAYFSDSQDSASGTPLSQIVFSGLFPSSLNVTLPTEGFCTESVTLVGNQQEYKTSAFTFTGKFNNAGAPKSGPARRQNVVFGNNQSRLPTVIPGIATSGFNIQTAGQYGAHIQSIRISTNLGRDPLYEIGRRGPYHRVAQFPVQVQSDFETYCLQGGGVTALEESEANLSNETIYILLTDGTILDLGSRNKLSNQSETGGNAQANGGNRTCTYSFFNFNSLTITHDSDPAGL